MNDEKLRIEQAVSTSPLNAVYDRTAYHLIHLDMDQIALDTPMRTVIDLLAYFGPWGRVLDDA